jgi:hypothetical protein
VLGGFEPPSLLQAVVPSTAAHARERGKALRQHLSQIAL